MEKKYNHAEAFCLMKYRSKDHTKQVIIWNSRDGVTPFIVFIDDEEYQHYSWQTDIRAPHHVPNPGDYIFRTVTREDLYAQLKAHVAHLREHVHETGNPAGIKNNILDREDDYIEEEIKEMIERGEPHLEKVASGV